jgi:hypothetical protein
MPTSAPTSDQPLTAEEDIALTWAAFLGLLAASCDYYASAENRWGTRHELEDLDRRAARYRDLQLTKLHEVSKIRYESVA